MSTPEKLQITVRAFRPDDLEVIKQMTVEAFSGVSIDEAAEMVFGTINGHDWKWRKVRHIDGDVVREVEGILHAGVHSVPAGGTVGVCRIPGEEDPSMSQ